MALISLGLGAAGLAGKALFGGGGSARPSVQQTKISSSAFRQSRSPGTQKISKTSPLGGYGMVMGGGRMPKNVFLMPQVSGSADESVRDILFDIKRLLTADFQYRINKEQQEYDAIKKVSDQSRRSNKERALETTRKIGNAAGNITKRLISPLNNPLQAILGFLKNVLGGFVVNQGLNWLANNKQKVEDAFDWFRKNWEGVRNTTLAIIGGGILLDIGSKLAGVAYLANKLFSFFSPKKAPTLPGGGGSNAGVQSGNLRGLTNSQLSRSNQSYSRFISGKANIGDRLRLFSRGRIGFGGLFTRGGFNSSGALRGQFGKMNFKFNAMKSVANKAAGMFKKFGIGALGKILRILGLGFLAIELKRDIDAGDYKAVAVKLSAYGLGWLTTLVLNAIGVKLIAATPLTGGLSTAAGIGVFGASAFAGGAVDQYVRRSFGYNRGGIVRGGGPDRDSVMIAATPGEYLINRSMTNKFAPFLDDINYNGGSLYHSMYRALKEQDKNADSFAKTNRKFDRVLNDYKKIVSKKSGSSGIKSGPTSSPKIDSPSMNTSNGLTPTSGEGGINFVPMPTMKSSSSDTNNSMSTPAGGDSIPILDATDSSNLYIPYVMKEFGIVGG